MIATADSRERNGRETTFFCAQDSGGVRFAIEIVCIVCGVDDERARLTADLLLANPTS